jgi:hypothetical protein
MKAKIAALLSSLLLLLNFSPVSALAAGAAWSNASAWAVSELENADGNGLIPAVLQGADLTAPITRAEFAAVAVKTYELLSGQSATVVSPNPFTDTRDPEVLKAYHLGLVAGMSAGGFAPSASLEREQAAAMLGRAFKKATLPGWTLATDNSFPFPATTIPRFADDYNISAWAGNSVYFLAEQGILSGVGESGFAPRSTATREQAILIALRLTKTYGAMINTIQNPVVAAVPAPRPATVIKLVKLYLPDDNAYGFKLYRVISLTDPEELVKLLVTFGALPEGCAINSYSDPGEGLASVDMNSAFGAALKTNSTEKYLRLGALVNTLLTTSGAQQLKVTIDGVPVETGDAYHHPLKFYTNPNGSTPQESIPLDTFWSYLEGYWNAADGSYVDFTRKLNDPWFASGHWDKENEVSPAGQGGGVLALSDSTCKVTMVTPDVTLPHSWSLDMDLSRLHQDGTLRLRFPGGDWTNYSYGGKTTAAAEQAYNKTLKK